MKKQFFRLFDGIDMIGWWLGLLSLRIMLSWDFFESGLEKLHGENWFADIQGSFPFPLNFVPPEISWQMATWFELIGGIALLLGLATRFFSLSLIMLTIVAIASVHWPASWNTFGELMQGYGFTDQGYGNFKLPALFIGMLMPLLLIGPGRLSLDYWLRKAIRQNSPMASNDLPQVASQHS